MVVNRRHVCTSYKNVSYPVKTRQVFCKPTYKKYMVPCGTQWCEGVKVIYEKYHKDVVTDTNRTLVDYTCCPGWSQVTYRSYGCNKPVCNRPCLNGGKCVKPNCCHCPIEYTGAYCETKITHYDKPGCSPPCQHGGTCLPSGFCICPPGYTGPQCAWDIDECKTLKPCDQICLNTPGSYRCECKETFILQPDGQTCRVEDSEWTTPEAKDLELQRLEKWLLKLEKMISEKQKNTVTKKEINFLYENIEKISNNIIMITNKLRDLGDYKKEIDALLIKLNAITSCSCKPTPSPSPPGPDEKDDDVCSCSSSTSSKSEECPCPPKKNVSFCDCSSSSTSDLCSCDQNAH